MIETHQSPDAMAKKQKTIQLPEEVYELANAYESGSGVRFNRQILAGLLHLFFAKPESWPNAWIRIATGLEKGELTITDVPVEVAKYEASLAKSVLGRNPPPPGDPARDSIAWKLYEKETEPERAYRLAQADISSSESRVHDWERNFRYMETQERDPIEAILVFLRGACIEPEERPETPDSE